MPELPEVETVRRGLADLVVGQTINELKITNPKSFLVSNDEISNLIVNKKIISVKRRAKMLIINLDNSYSMLVHLKMTGQMIYRGQTNWGAGHPNDSFVGQLPDRSTRVEFTLSNGAKLFFNDQRKFGWIKIFPTDLIAGLDSIQKLGPEPLEGNPEKEFLQRARRRNRSSVKAVILDQTVLAGVGNIYADESLWLSKIHPATKVEQLTDSELKNLLKNIQKSMSDSLNAGGSSSRNYVKADGSKGNYLDLFASVYGKTDQPCRRCSTPITKIRVAGRGTHYCPKCQVLK